MGRRGAGGLEKTFPAARPEILRDLCPKAPLSVKTNNNILLALSRPSRHAQHSLAAGPDSAGVTPAGGPHPFLTLRPIWLTDYCSPYAEHRGVQVPGATGTGRRNRSKTLTSSADFPNQPGTPTKKKGGIKLPTKSTKVVWFMPMLESLAERDELNEVVKNRVVKSCELMDAGVNLFANGFVKQDGAADLTAKYEGADAEALESAGSFTLAGRIVSLRSFG